MFFFTRLKKEFVPLFSSVNGIASLFVLLLLTFVSGPMLYANSDIPEDNVPSSWSEFIPLEWQENIIVPSLMSTMVIINHGPAASGIPGNTGITLRYTVKNDGMDTLNCIQIAFDVGTQIGKPPFVALTGSLSARTGSGFVFGPPITGSATMVYGGNLNDFYDGMSNDTVFTNFPTLAPDQCISVDFPFEIGDTAEVGTIIVQATTTGKTNIGDPISSSSPPLTLVQGCRSVSLACAGKVNITLGPDCKALVTLNTVFLNTIVDPNRFTLVVYDGNDSIGNMLNETHVGKELTYSVLDGCFNNRASCWGTIVLENKNTPVRTSTYQEIFCGEDPKPIGTLFDIIDSVRLKCSVAITDFQEVYNTSGDKCVGHITTRVVIGEYEIDGWKSRDTIHIDTIIEKPLDLMMIEYPKGGPDGKDAITVNCDSLGLLYPTPEFIEGYYNSLPATTGSGTAYSYPYINQGTQVMEMYTTTDTILQTTKDTMLLIDGIWVNVKIILKDTTTITDTTFIIKPDLVPIKTGTTCNLTVNYKDAFFPGCVGPESKIMRTWTILDWCSGNLATYDQWIIIDDDRGPDIVMPDTVYVGVVPWICTAEYPLFAEVSDNCSQVRNLNWTANAGVIGEDNVLRDVVPSDSPVLVKLQAIDDCGNDSTKTIVVFVVDSIPPVAIAKDQLNTSIIYDPVKDRGLAKVTAESLNQGSHDSGCGPVTLCVLLDEELDNPILEEDGSPARDTFGNILYHAIQCEIDGVYKGYPYVICRDAVKFCCDQLGEQRVALIVNDLSDLSGPGISWGIVNVEDKSFPIVDCQNLTVKCGTDIHPDSIGYPGLSNGLCKSASLTYIDIEDVNDCGVGQVVRTWYVDGLASCTQIISIEGSSIFDPRSIKWPKHYNDQSVIGINRECVNDTIVEWVKDIEMGSSFVCGSDVLDVPVWCETTCSMLFMSYEDTDAEAGDGCKKIVRKWTVIDWCLYTPNSNNINEDNDIFEAVSDEDIATPNIKADLYAGDLCEACDKPSSQNANDVFFRYKTVDIDGYYNFDQIIKIVDNTAPVIDAPDEVFVEISDGATSKDDNFDDCIGNKDVVAHVVELCGEFVLDASTVRWLIEVQDEDGVILETKTVFGDSAVVNSQNGMGNTEHIIYWYATDGCGNEASAQTVVIFKDILDPSPLCIRELSTASMNVSGGGVTIWASDFDHGSYDNCSEVKTFFRNDEGFVTASLTFTCDDIPDGISTTKQLLLYVSDEAGNESSCNIALRIDDNANVCTDSLVGEASIAGQVMTYTGDMIEAARVSLNFSADYMTDVNGAYAFLNVPMASSYKITGSKNDDPLNGVSTLDLVLIQRHILALDLFDSPYKTIAADINSDGKVSAVDLVQLRRLLLGYTPGFTENESWRFVDPTQEFASPTQPWPFTEELVIQDLMQNMNDQNMFGVKIGDVSGNVIANSLLAGNRSVGQFKLYINDRFVREGQTIDVPVSVIEASKLSGLQFTIDATKVKLEKILPGDLGIAQVHYAVHNDQTISLAWSNGEAVDVSADLFKIRLTAREDINISEALTFSDRITSAKAYGTSYDPLVLEILYNLEDNGLALDRQFELLQNEPNPFNHTTTIGFIIAREGPVKLSITDISGRTVYTAEGSYSQGYNEFILYKDQLQARGILYYSVESAGFTDTRKMIIIE